MEEWSVRVRPFVFAPSAYVAGQIEKAYGIKKVAVIESPFFEEARQVDPSVYEAPSRRQELSLFFGRLTQMKGVHVLARALPLVLERCPDLHVVLLGADAPAPGGGMMRDFVHRHAGSHAGRVLFLDPLRHEQLYPFIDHARFVVLPSLVDNMPNTLLEAMGHGKSVIGTTGSCFEQLLTEGENGLLVPPGRQRPPRGRHDSRQSIER